MPVPPHRAAFWVGESGPVLEHVPHGAEIEVIRELADDKYRVRTKSGQGLMVQEWDAFQNEVVFM